MPYILGLQIAIGSIFLVSESAHYLTMTGLGASMAWAVAASMESGVLILATHRGHAARVVTVALVALSLAVSSLGRVIPLAQSDTATAGQSARLSAMDADIARLDAAARSLADAGQRVNHAAISRQLAEAIEERAAVMAKIEEQPTPVIVPIQIGAVILVRLLLQLVNILCAGRMSGMLRPADIYQRGAVVVEPKTEAKPAPKTAPKPEPKAITATQKPATDGGVNIDEKILAYIQKNGEVNRNRLIMSGCINGKTADYDTALDRLISAGVVMVHKNGGGKAGWKYREA